MELTSGKYLVGVEDVDYNNRDGRHITGVRIHVASELPSPSIGFSVSTEFIIGASSRDFIPGPIVAVNYEPAFKAGTYRCTGVIYQ